MLKFAHLNTNRSRQSMDMLISKANFAAIDVLLVTEPNFEVVNNAGWQTDTRKDAAALIRNKQVKIRGSGEGVDFMWLELAGVDVYSVYCSPNSGIKDFLQILSTK